MFLKRIGMAIVVSMFLAGCATQVMNVAYKVPKEPPLKMKPIYLKIKDVRTVRGFLSPAVKKKDIFSGGTVGFFDLVTQTPRGKSTSIKDATVEQAFQEAFRVRFESGGLGLLPQPDPDKLSLIIEIERLWLDLVGHKFKAEVSYTARFFRGQKEIHKERISGRAERFQILARRTAEETVSEAFTMAVNSIDLSVFLKK